MTPTYQADQDIMSHVSMFRNNLQMFLNNMIVAALHLRSRAKFRKSARQIFFDLDLNSRLTKFHALYDFLFFSYKRLKIFISNKFFPILLASCAKLYYKVALFFFDKVLPGAIGNQ